MANWLKKSLVFGVLPLFCVVFGLILLWLVNVKIWEDKITESLESEIIAIENTIYDKLDHTKNIMNSMILMIKERPYDKKHANEVLKIYKNNPYFIDDFSWTLFSWTNNRFKIIVDGKYGIMKKPYDLSNRDYVDATKENPGELILGTPVIGSTSYKWMIPGGVGARLKGKFLGTMTIGFEIEVLANLIQKSISNSDSSFVLLYEDGKPILRAESIRYSSYRNLDRDVNDSILTAVCDLSDTNYDQLISVNLARGEVKALLIHKSHKYPFILALKYDEAKIWAKLLESYISKVKIMVLFLMLLTSIVLAVRFAFV